MPFAVIIDELVSRSQINHQNQQEIHLMSPLSLINNP